MKDIKRLSQIVHHLNKIEVILCKMDEKEYERMRDYISDRFDILFPPFRNLVCPTDK